VGIFLEMRSLTTNNLSRQSKTLGKMADSDGNYVRFEFKNSWPVELSDLTGALSAFGGAYKDHVVSAGMRLRRERAKTRALRRSMVLAPPELHWTAGERPPAPTSGASSSCQKRPMGRAGLRTTGIRGMWLIVNVSCIGQGGRIFQSFVQ
jgi:hypothetical protein